MSSQTDQQKVLLRLKWHKAAVDYARKYGVSQLNPDDIVKNGHKKLANCMRRYKVCRKTVAEEINESDAFKKAQKARYRVGTQVAADKKGYTFWTEDTFDKTAKSIVEKYGFMPPVTFLSENGYHNFVCHITTFAGSANKLRKKYDTGANNSLRSIDRKVWKSFAETCLANYLLAHGIMVEHGEDYPKEYLDLVDRQSGQYDMHFMGSNGIYMNNKINVEIWGGGRANATADGSLRYSETRLAKETFNKNDTNFLGIDYKICYDSKKLAHILEPFIGVPELVVETHGVPANYISVYEEVVQQARDLCSKLPGNKFPSLNWLHRSGPFETRTIYDWEPRSWAGFVGRVTKIGTNKIKAALGEYVQEPWTVSNLTEEFRKLYQEHARTPYAIEGHLSRQETLTSSQKELIKRARAAANAAQRLSTHREICAAANIPNY